MSRRRPDHNNKWAVLKGPTTRELIRKGEAEFATGSSAAAAGRGPSHRLLRPPIKTRYDKPPRNRTGGRGFPLSSGQQALAPESHLQGVARPERLKAGLRHPWLPGIPAAWGKSQIPLASPLGHSPY
jgi:hypothetical protein